MAFDKADCYMQGRPIPGDLLGELNEIHRDDLPNVSLTNSLQRDGYFLVRNAISAEDVLAAREEVFGRLAEVDEIREPVRVGIATGTSRRVELNNDLGTFWRSVSQGAALRRVSHGAQANAIFAQLFSEAARPHDYIFLRPGVVGRATLLHYDLPFFARGSQRIVTAWTALGDIPVCDGGLVVVEASHHFDDLIAPIKGIDYNSNDSPQVQVMQDAIQLVRNRDSRFLTTNFAAGDMIVFSLTTLHGTLDNHSPVGRTRLSCDVRWQPAADPVDPRYMGDNPPGTTGAGYGELNGAKPLTEEWHTR